MIPFVIFNSIKKLLLTNRDTMKSQNFGQTNVSFSINLNIQLSYIYQKNNKLWTENSYWYESFNVLYIINTEFIQNSNMYKNKALT